MASDTGTTASPRSSGSETLLWSDLVLTGVGLSTTILTALALAFVTLRYRVALYAFTWRAVIPYGALICGLLATSGYDLAARVIGKRPGTLGRVSILASPLIAYFLIFTFEYLLLDIEGVPVTSTVSFTSFVDAVVRSTSVFFMGLRLSSSGALGAFGYWLLVLNGLGFAAAGFVMLVRLNQLACRDCGRYMPRPTSTSGFGTPAQLTDTYSRVERLAGAGQLQMARSVIDGLPQAQGSHQHKLTLELSGCESCRSEFFRLRLLTLRRPTATGYVPIGKTSPEAAWVPTKGFAVAGQVSSPGVNPSSTD